MPERTLRERICPWPGACSSDASSAPGGLLPQEGFEERAGGKPRLFLELPAEMKGIGKAALFGGFLDGTPGIPLEEHDAFPEFLFQRIFRGRAVQGLCEETVRRHGTSHTVSPVPGFATSAPQTPWHPGPDAVFSDFPAAAFPRSADAFRSVSAETQAGSVPRRFRWFPEEGNPIPFYFFHTCGRNGKPCGTPFPRVFPVVRSDRRDRCSSMPWPGGARTGLSCAA